MYFTLADPVARYSRWSEIVGALLFFTGAGMFVSQAKWYEHRGKKEVLGALLPGWCHVCHTRSAGWFADPQPLGNEPDSGTDVEEDPDAKPPVATP